MSLHVPSAIEARSGYRLWIRFPDGVEGTVNLSALVGEVVFRRWKDDPATFQNVVIAEDGSLLWDGELDLCADALYLEVSGKSADEVFPRLNHELQNA